MQQIEISLNGKTMAISPSTTIASILESGGFDSRYMAVVINERVSPRSEHAVQRFQPGDRVEVLMPFVGG